MTEPTEQAVLIAAITAAVKAAQDYPKPWTIAGKVTTKSFFENVTITVTIERSVS